MTIQVRDALSVDGTAYRLSTSPIESYFRQHPERRPNFETPDSSVWRGYVAEWAIDDGQLYLVGLTGWLHDESAASSLRQVGPGSIFPASETGAGRVLADWFSGDLEVELADVSTQTAASETGGGRVLADWSSADLEAQLAEVSMRIAEAPGASKRVFGIDRGRVVSDASLPLPDQP